MNARIVTLFLLLVVSLVALTGSLYVVRETERAVVLRFGALIDVDSKPGLHVKIPFVDEVRKFDARVLTLDAPAITVRKRTAPAVSPARCASSARMPPTTATSGQSKASAQWLTSTS